MIDNYKTLDSKLTGKSITSYLTVLLLVVYALGYLIDVIYVKSYGAINVSIVKPDFIMIGFTFCIISSSFIVLSLLYFVIRDLRKIRGKSLRGLKRSYFILVNYCLVLIFYAAFITKEEWREKINVFNLFSLRLKVIFLMFFVGILVGIVVISIFEGTLDSLSKRMKDEEWFKKWLKWLKWMGVSIEQSQFINFYDKFSSSFIEYWRWFFLVLSLIMDYLLIIKIPWLKILIYEEGKYYLGMLFIAVFVSLRLRNAKRDSVLLLRDAKYDSDKMRAFKLSNRLIMIWCTFIPILVFLMAFSYSISIFRLMPKNRGGMMPLYKTIFYLRTKGGEFNSFASIIDSKKKNRTKPLYILFTDNEYYYVSNCYPLWKIDDNRHLDDLFMLRKANVYSMERIRSNPRYDKCLSKE